MRPIRTFRGKMIVVVAVTSAVTALLISALLLSRHSLRVHSDLLKAIQSEAEVLAIHSVAALRFNDPEAAQETLDALEPIDHLIGGALFDRDGRMLAQYRTRRAAPVLTPKAPGPRQTGTTLIFEEPVRQGPDRLGTVVLAYDLAWERRDLGASILFTILVAMMAIGLGLAAAWPLQRALERPVGELVSVAASVATRGDFSMRAQRFSDDELGSLTDVFNSMLARVETHDETLRQANERYDLVNRATNDVLWDWNLATDSMHWSDAAQRSLGYAPAELGDSIQGWQEHLHPDDRTRVIASLLAAIDGSETTWTQEYRFLRKDSTYGDYIDRALIERNGGGRAERVIGSMLDVTQRRRAEKAVLEAAQRLRTLMDAIPVFVWEADSAGLAVEFNERWHSYTGLGPERSRGTGWIKAVHPEDRVECQRRWQAALSTLSPFDAELRVQRADGVYRWFVMRALPVRTEEGILGWYGTSLDIEDRKKVEEERDALLASERAARSDAEQASRMKDEFLATLSHELRTPLAAILGWAQVLRETEGVQTDAHIADAVRVIERNARAQTQLIEDLLDMSRIVSGKLRLEVQEVELADVIEAAIQSVQPAADAKEIRIQRIMDPNVGTIHGDPGRLQQVVWNLLANAIKFTPKSGRVQVALQRINSHIEINVSDTGAGIEPRFLPYLFERFRQADSSTTRQFGGLGLGLAISKNLVELHGGTIRASSSGVGQGATFSIVLPLAIVHPRPSDESRQHPRTPGPQPRPAIRDAATLQGLRVLVVEDDEDARRLVKLLLERQGATVCAISSATQAIAALQEFHPDVMVSDIGMPGMDGYQLIELIRKLPANEGGSIPALALTAFARSDDRTRALRAGYEMHVSKPIEPVELIESVAALARSARRLDGATKSPNHG